MKVRFNLSYFDIATTQKRITDYQGNTLITTTLESILSLITSKYLYNEYETVEIHHTKFANITSNYRKYLNYLRDKSIILINESYKEGEHSKSYLFTDYFKEYATITGFKSEPKADKGELENQCLMIDKMVCERIEQDFKSVNIKAIPVEKEVMFIKDGRDIINFKNYILNESGLYRLRTNPRVLNWCSGRLYTPFVQLSSAVRRDYLYFDSQLTSLDIKRSFPLWLVVWLLENGIEMDYETKCFISAVRSGNIYPDLIKKFNNNKNLFNNTEFDKPYIDKFEVKKHFGIWLNGNNDRNNLTNLIFRTYYPNIFDFVNQYKTGDKDKMYHTLVKLETDFIFNHVCRRLYYEIPDLQLLTCHDEVYFEGRYKQAVEQIWNQELEKVYQKITVGGNSDFDIDENENDFDSDSDFDFGSESLM